MITGRFNIILGLVAMILAGVTGFALGLTLERYFQTGYAQITFWRQPGGVHGDSRAPTLPATGGSQPTRRFSQRLVNLLFLQPLQKAVQRREIGHAAQS